jgi:hypothetical protein
MVPTRIYEQGHEEMSLVPILALERLIEHPQKHHQLNVFRVGMRHATRFFPEKRPERQARVRLHQRIVLCPHMTTNHRQKTLEAPLIKNVDFVVPFVLKAGVGPRPALRPAGRKNKSDQRLLLPDGVLEFHSCETPDARVRAVSRQYGQEVIAVVDLLSQSFGDVRAELDFLGAIGVIPEVDPLGFQAGHDLADLGYVLRGKAVLFSPRLFLMTEGR